MKCIIKYRHPTNGNRWWLKDLSKDKAKPKPIGCHEFCKQNATIYHSKEEAESVANYLESIGYKAWIYKATP